MRDDSGVELYFPGAEWPEDEVDEWLEGADYSWVKRTTIFRFYAYQKHINRLGDVGVDESTIEEFTMCIHPEPPKCKDGAEHDWRRPIEIVGGLEENPGVVGHGGGVIIREVCSHCGVYRVTDTSHAYEAIWYEDADEASKDWVESLEEGEKMKMKMNEIINLTQHPATADQVVAGVVDLPEQEREVLKDLLTFDEPPTHREVVERAAQIVALTRDHGAERAMIGGAPYLMGPLERLLKAWGVQPFYAFTRREVVEEELPDGSVNKRAVFRHAGWVEV